MLSSNLADERYTSGFYDDLTERIRAMGKSSLAEVEYEIDFHRTVEQWSGNYSYRRANGDDFKINIFGQIASTESGTIIAAKGNYYAGKGDQVRPLSDDARVKDVLVVSTPTGCNNTLDTLFYNQIGSLNSIRESDEQEEITNNVGCSVRDWIRNAMGDDSSMKDHIVLHMLPKYGNPNGKGSNVRRVVKRSVEPPPNDSDSTLSSSSVGKGISAEPVVRRGAFYDPRLNEDCRGPFFNLVNNKLVQLDVLDQGGNLIAPWKFYDALKPGTLILAECSLHCFLMRDRGNLKKIYQINACNVRVLDDSDGPPIPREVPVLPLGEQHSTEVNANARTASDAFANFSVPKRRKIEKKNANTADGNGGHNVRVVTREKSKK